MQSIRGFSSIGPAVVAGLVVVAVGGGARAQTKVACVGDSITAGAGSTVGNDYPAVLGRLLGAAWQVHNFGDGGKTMMKMPANPPGESYWLQPTYPASKAYGAAVVVIMLGTNDSKTANWRGGNNQYDADYRAMIGEFQALPSKPKVYAVLPPPSTIASFSISGTVIQNEIVPIIKKIAADMPSVGLIDVFDAFQPMPMQYLTGDGVHPNDKGHALLAQTVAKALTAAPGADGGIDAAADGAADGARDVAAEGGAADGAGGTGGAPGTGGAAGTGGSPGGGTGGSPGGGSGGSTGSGGNSADAGAPSASSPDSGCSCRVTGGPVDGWLFLLFAAGLIAAAQSRRNDRDRAIK